MRGTIPLIIALSASADAYAAMGLSRSAPVIRHRAPPSFAPAPTPLRTPQSAATMMALNAPPALTSAVKTSLSLGGIVGVHMRIDLFASARGTPTLGEFTPWHSNGKMHCDMRQLDSRHLLPGATRRRHGTTGEQHWVDMCRLGRIWYEKDELEGGVARGSTPAAMRGWPMLMYNEHGKCLAATKLLQPASWSGTDHGADATKLHRDK